MSGDPLRICSLARDHGTLPFARMMRPRLGNITRNEDGGCATVLSSPGTVAHPPQNENLAAS